MSQLRVPLEVLKIDKPCTADWASMTGDDQRRFCTHCNKHVHDISKMSRGAAEELICNSAGQLCVRMQQDAAGTVMTLDYAQPKVSRRRFVALCLGALGAGAAVFGVWSRKLPPAPVLMPMGSIAPPPPPPGQKMGEVSASG